MSILGRKLRRDLARQKWQFVAVSITIVLGVMLFAASFDAFRNLTRSYDQTYESLDFADLTVSGGDQDSFAASAASTDGVGAVTRRTQADVPLLVGENHKLFGRIVGMPVDDQPPVDQVKVVTGAYLSTDKPDGVLVEQHMADHFDLVPGDSLQVFLGSGFVDVEVVGVVVSAEYLWPARSRQDIFTTPDDFGVLFVPEALAQQAPASTQVAQTLVLYDPDADAASLDKTLSTQASDDSATNIETQADQPSNATLSEDVQGFGQLSFMFPLLFLTAAGLATFILLNRIVRTQRAQIGTLLANGMSPRVVLRHYLSFGLVVGLGGAVVGAVVGVVLGSLITGAYTSALAIPDTVVGFYPTTLVVGIGFGLVMGLLAAYAPARSATRVDPAEAMRGSPPAVSSGRSLLERVIPPIRRAPIRWRMSLRGIGRSKRRSASTVIGVVLSLTLILASWGMLDTTQILLARQFDDIAHNDAQVFFTTAMTDDLVQEVATTDGVSDAEQVVTLAATIRNGDEQYASQLQAFDADTQMHTFLDGDTPIPLPDKGLLAGRAVDGLIGAKVGDTVTVAFPSLNTSVSTTIAGFVDESFGTFLYMQRDELATLLDQADPAVAETSLESPAVASVMVIYNDGADPDTVQGRLFDLPSVAAVISSNAIKSLIDSAMALFYVFVGVMLAFGALMAFALIFNMISVNVAERSVELATMRASGLSVREVNHLLTGENLLLTAIGIPIGLVVGYGVSWLFMASYTSDLFSFDLQMRWTTLLFSALAIVATSLLSQIPARRVVRRLDIAEVVRERSQ